MILIIAEKPDLMRKIAAAVLTGNQKKTAKKVNGRDVNVVIEDEDVAVTCSHGHLFRYMFPNEIDEVKYKSWKMENLPFCFEDIPLIASDDAFNKCLINSTKELLERPEITEVVCACDADREGESIPRETINMIALKSAKVKKLNQSRKFTRMWYTEQGSDALLESFENRRPLSDYDNIYQSARARQFADYKVGLTATEAMTIKLGKKGSVMTVGRVQTPTLRIVVDLEKEIQNFVPVDFYKIIAHTDDGIDGEYQLADTKDNRFSAKMDAQKVVDKTGTGVATVTKAETKESKQSPKKLYSMSSLQADMNRRYNLTAHQTLEIAQKLYESAMTTYPRTEDETVSKEFADRIQSSMFTTIPVHSDILSEIKSNGFKLSTAVIASSTANVGAHEAITPSTSRVTEAQFNSLNDAEKKVYLAIVERFLENFYPPAIYDVLTIEFSRNGSNFLATYKALKKPGFLTVSKKDDTSDKLKKVNVGDELNISRLELVSSKTQAPARFTEASLIEMMKNPIKYLNSKDEKDIIKETSGIGTGATRDAIIEGLKKQNLIAIEKKSVVPTEKGIRLINSIPSEHIKSVSLTAYFETKLKDIYNGNYTFERFQAEIDALMRQFVKEVSAMEDSKETGYEKEVLCTCPQCGSDVTINKFGYYCENKECGVKIYTTQLQKALKLNSINKTNAKELLTKGITSRKVKLKSKQGKDYEAYLTYEFKAGEQYPNNVWITFDKK